MKLIALGTGTCVHPPGTPPRMPPLFALDVSETPAPQWVLFDCSEGARWRLPAVGIDPLDIAHLALSHPHADHAALPQFFQARACEAGFGRATDRSLPLALYLPRACADALADLWRWHAPEDHGVLTTRFALHVHPAGDGFTASLAPGVTLSAWEVVHAGAPAVAWRVESPRGTFAYSGDSGVCDALIHAARGADLFVCEAAARVGDDHRMRQRHLTPRQAGDIARLAGARELWLTHYDGRDPADAMIEDVRASGFAGTVRVATDGDSAVFGHGA